MRKQTRFTPAGTTGIPRAVLLLMAAFDWKPAALGGVLILKCFVAVAACNEHDQEKAGQTITTAAERTVEHAADAGARELKKEWNEMNVKVSAPAKSAP